jgi:hypothetical protein
MTIDHLANLWSIVFRKPRKYWRAVGQDDVIARTCLPKNSVKFNDLGMPDV